MSNKFLKILLLLVLLFWGIIEMNAQFIQNSSQSLFSDVKAFKTGDALMVLIVEDTKADNAASTSNSRETEFGGGVDFSSGSDGFNGSGSVNTGTDFRGKGQTSRKETIRSRLSVRVLEVEENGNLKIEGTRTTKINGETQTIVIRGIVRPVDVKPDNSVYSYNILDLTLLIEGDGTVTETQEPGLITKFLRFLF